MGFKDALSLRGKMRFAEGQTHARTTAPLARLLSLWSSVGLARSISSEIALGVSSTVVHFKRAGPRTIGPRRPAPPCVVFIDGACEEDAVSIEGVLLDARKKAQLLVSISYRTDGRRLEDKMHSEVSHRSSGVVSSACRSLDLGEGAQGAADHLFH